MFSGSPCPPSPASCRPLLGGWSALCVVGGWGAGMVITSQLEESFFNRSRSVFLFAATRGESFLRFSRGRQHIPISTVCRLNASKPAFISEFFGMSFGNALCAIFSIYIIYPTISNLCFSFLIYHLSLPPLPHTPTPLPPDVGRLVCAVLLWGSLLAWFTIPFAYVLSCPRPTCRYCCPPVWCVA